MLRDGCSAAELVATLAPHGCLEPIVGNARSPVRTLGMRLHKRRDKIIGGRKIVWCRNAVSNATEWRLVRPPAPAVRTYATIEAEAEAEQTGPDDPAAVRSDSEPDPETKPRSESESAPTDERLAGPIASAVPAVALSGPEPEQTARDGLKATPAEPVDLPDLDGIADAFAALRRPAARPTPRPVPVAPAEPPEPGEPGEADPLAAVARYVKLYMAGVDAKLAGAAVMLPGRPAILPDVWPQRAGDPKRNWTHARIGLYWTLDLDRGLIRDPLTGRPATITRAARDRLLDGAGCRGRPSPPATGSPRTCTLWPANWTFCRTRRPTGPLTTCPPTNSWSGSQA